MGRDWLSLLWDWVPFKYPWPNTPPETVWVTLRRCQEEEGWRSVTVEGVEFT